MLTVVGNILWLILCGIWMAILYYIGGLLGLILIITIPLGIQSFKLGNYVLWPFGRTVVTEPGASVVWSVVGNVIWVIIAGWWLALFHVLLAVIFFITIIGIPFGIANLKLARLALLPFGAMVVTDVPPDAQTIVAVPQLGTSSTTQAAPSSTPSPEMGDRRTRAARSHGAVFGSMNGIILRNSRPTSSIWWARFAARCS